MSDNNLPFLWQQTYAALFAATSKLQASGDTVLKHLTSRQLMVLIAILHLDEDNSTLSNVARMIGATKQSTKQMVDLLKKKQYIETKSNPLDKRAATLFLTEEGKAIVKEDYDIGMEMFKNFFKDFTEEELTTFWELLKRLYRFDGKEHMGFEK